MKKQTIVKLESGRLFGFKLDQKSDKPRITSAASAKIGKGPVTQKPVAHNQVK